MILGHALSQKHDPDQNNYKIMSDYFFITSFGLFIRFLSLSVIYNEDKLYFVVYSNLSLSK